MTVHSPTFPRISDGLLEQVAFPAGYTGRGFMYVAVCSGPEEMIKVGLSHDPVARWSAFHPRWFEAFDLDHSLLIETETRREAQALETALHRRLIDHNCPLPMTMRQQFGGETEWYRGAYRMARDFAGEAAANGYVVHEPARTWFAQAMERRTDSLFGLLDQALRDALVGGISAIQRRALRNLVDSHAIFDPGLVARLPTDFATFCPTNP